MDFTVGQKTWFTQPLFHKEGIVCGEITKIGKKYIYVKGPYREFKFDKVTLREVTDTNYRGRIYLAKEDYLKEVELSTNKQKIRKLVNDNLHAFTLEQTREILKLINQTK